MQLFPGLQKRSLPTFFLATGLQWRVMDFWLLPSLQRSNKTWMNSHLSRLLWSPPRPLKLALHRYSVGITKRKTLWYSWRYRISIDSCAIMCQHLAESTQLLIVWSRPEKQQDHMSLETRMYRRISARRNSIWSRPIIWTEWMSSLCGYPLCQRALCHILPCAPCVLCLSLHYSIP